MCELMLNNDTETGIIVLSMSLWYIFIVPYIDAKIYIYGFTGLCMYGQHHTYRPIHHKLLNQNKYLYVYIVLITVYWLKKEYICFILHLTMSLTFTEP